LLRICIVERGILALNGLDPMVVHELRFARGPV